MRLFYLQLSRILLMLCLLSLISCSSEIKNGKLHYTESNPDNGFKFPYLLFIPDGMETENELVLVVEPNNSGFASDDFKRHLEKAERTASRDFYLGNYVARELKYPLLVPVFPRPESDWKIYTYAYDRDLALQKGNDMERADLQLLAMVDHARKILSEKGFNINDKILMTGFSASGTFVNRFSAIHPEKVMAYAAGGVNGLLILPLDELNGEALPFPVGVHDFQLLFGKTFNAEAFKNTPQLLFMGENDDNDAILFDDGYDEKERSLIFRLLGEEMQPLRWQKCREIYTEENVDAEIITVMNTGHEQTGFIKNEVVDFFRIRILKSQNQN
jgi:hypothetical protein